MATTIFPQNGDTVTEQLLQEQVRLAQGYALPIRQFTFPIQSTSGLDLTLGPGKANVWGTLVDVNTSTTITAPDNDTTFLFVALTRSGGLVQSPTSDGDNFTFLQPTDIPSTTGFGATNPEDYCPLYKITTASGQITQIVDLRWTHSGATGAFAFTPTNTRSDAVLTRDPEIAAPFFWLGNTAQYWFRCTLRIGAGFNAGGIKWSFGGLSSSITYLYRAWDLGPTPSLVAVNQASTGSSVGVTGGANQGLVIMEGTETLGLIQSIWLNWAQNTSNGTDTRIDYSCIEVSSIWPPQENT